MNYALNEAICTIFDHVHEPVRMVSVDNFRITRIPGGEGQDPLVDRRHHPVLTARHRAVRKCYHGGHLHGAHEANHARRRRTGQEAGGRERDDQTQGRSLQELREEGSRSQGLQRRGSMFLL